MYLARYRQVIVGTYKMIYNTETPEIIAAMVTSRMLPFAVTESAKENLNIELKM